MNGLVHACFKIDLTAPPSKPPLRLASFTSLRPPRVDKIGWNRAVLYDEFMDVLGDGLKYLDRLNIVFRQLSK